MLRFCMACLVWISVSAAMGQPTRPNDLLAGDLVVAIDDAELKVENRVVDRMFPGLVVTVEAVKGDWLWVRNEKAGWIERRHVRLPDDAIAFFKEMERRSPKDPVPFFGQAQGWFAKQQYRIAIVNFDIAILLSPNATYYCCRAASWQNEGNFEHAISDYDAALALNPNDALILNGRAEAWMASGNLDRAYDDFDHALRIQPEFVAAWVGRASVAANRGDYQKSVADFTEALRLDPQYPGAFLNRALAYEFQRLHREAIADYERALALSPADQITNWRLAWLLATSADPTCRNGKKAIALATMACTLSDWNASPCFEALAAACAETGDFERAVHWQFKAIEFASSDQDNSKMSSKLELYRQRKPYRTEPKK